MWKKCYDVKSSSGFKPVPVSVPVPVPVSVPLPDSIFFLGVGSGSGAGQPQTGTATQCSGISLELCVKYIGSVQLSLFKKNTSSVITTYVGRRN